MNLEALLIRSEVLVLLFSLIIKHHYISYLSYKNGVLILAWCLGPALSLALDDKSMLVRSCVKHLISYTIIS